MNITKHGTENKKELKTEKFKCSQCGCEFTADYDEYYVKKGSQFEGPMHSGVSTAYVYSANVTDIYVCSCPECHKIILMEKHRLIENPCITLTGSDSASTSSVSTDIYCKQACSDCNLTLEECRNLLYKHN